MDDVVFASASGWTNSANANDGDPSTAATDTVAAGMSSATFTLSSATLPGVDGGDLIEAVRVHLLVQSAPLSGQTIVIADTVEIGGSGNLAGGMPWGEIGSNDPAWRLFEWRPDDITSVSDFLSGLTLSVVAANIGSKPRGPELRIARVEVLTYRPARIVPNAEALNAEADGDAILTFAEITHPALSEPLRVVADVLPYTWQGHEWHPVMFEFEAVTDNENTPEARITLPAIDRTISEALIALPQRAQISVWVLTSADFDLSTEPREQIGAPIPLMELLNFDLMDVQGDVSTASGRLMLRDYSQEPWPGIRATESRCPGLFA